MDKNNVFTTPTYYINNFKSKDELEKHLEFKIAAVKFEHSTVWNIVNVERNITETTAFAKIFMTRK